MAGITKKKGGKCWYACWKDADGRTVCKSTGVKLAGGGGVTVRAAERMARQVAEAMEQAAKGTAPMANVRAAAELSGAGMTIPTVRGYLEGVPRTAGHQAESNRVRAFAVFMEFLGAAGYGDASTMPRVCAMGVATGEPGNGGGLPHVFELRFQAGGGGG